MRTSDIACSLAFQHSPLLLVVNSLCHPVPKSDLNLMHGLDTKYCMSLCCMGKHDSQYVSVTHTVDTMARSVFEFLVVTSDIKETGALLL